MEIKKIKIVVLNLISLISSDIFSQQIAVPDTISVNSGGMVIKNIIQNDIGYPSLTLDTILYYSGKGTATRLAPGNNSLKYKSDSSYFGNDTVYYVVCNGAACDTGVVYVNVDYVFFDKYAHLDINQVSARFNSGSNHFWNVSTTAKYIVPKDSGTTTIFAYSLWIGGKDSINNIHIAAERYKSGGDDFWPGPVSDSIYYDLSYDTLWNKIWKINKSQIDSHVNYWSKAWYVIPDVINKWPAHGDVNKGQAYNLAPFYDNNNNGYYDPSAGDHPLICGDQAVYFIYNDDRDLHTETAGGKKLKTEIHGMAYAFNEPLDTALNHTIFINYKIFNRSSSTYDSTYLGTFVDFDLGNPIDDYMECDVERGSFFVYNGDSFDENNQGAKGYGTSPPAQAVVYLAGPWKDKDGIDNSLVYNYNITLQNDGIPYSGLGSGFSDGIIDNERTGLTSFRYMQGNTSNIGTPENWVQYYGFLTGKWKDGTNMVYGGNGHQSSPLANPNIKSLYAYPDSTDPLGWGTEGFAQVAWDEFNGGYTPYDRHGVGATGPFTFKPGDVQEFDIAFVYARDLTDTSDKPSVSILKQRIDEVRNHFFNNPKFCFNSSPLNTQESNIEPNNLKIFPNPSAETIYVSYSEKNLTSHYVIYNLLGEIVLSGNITGRVYPINISYLKSGVYIFELNTPSANIQRQKFVKR
jgi:hypothetical protein